MARPNSRSAISLHVKGLKEAKARFQALPEIVREAMLHATEVTVREITRNAQARIQRSPAVRTRALHDHIGWSVTRSNGRGRAGVRSGTTMLTTIANFAAGEIGGRRIRVKGIITPGANGGAAGAKRVQPTRYAHFVEFGTRHMPAEPFMIPSAETEKPNYLARCRAAGQVIERDASVRGGRLL